MLRRLLEPMANCIFEHLVPHHRTCKRTERKFKHLVPQHQPRKHRTGTVNSKFSYSAVPNPQDHSKHFTLYFPETIRHHLNCSGRHPAITLQLMHRGCTYTYPPLSIARYSFIQLRELEQCRVKNLAQGQDSNPGRLRRKSEALPLSHCTLCV